MITPLKFVFLFFAVCYCRADVFITKDLTSIRTYINESIDVLAESLSRNILNFKEGIKLYYSLGFTAVTFTINKIAAFYNNYTGYINSVYINSSINYYVLKPFIFDMDTKFVWTYGIVPIIGTCKLRFTALNGHYMLYVNTTKIIPSFKGTVEMKVFDIDNPIATGLGFENAVQPALKNIGDYMLKMINKSFYRDGINYYRGRFGNHNQYIKIPYIKNQLITIMHRLSNYTVELVNTRYAIVSRFNQTMIPSIDMAKDLYIEDYSHCVQYSKSELMKISKLIMKNANNITLTNNDIPAESYFRIDSLSLSRAVSQLLYDNKSNSYKVVLKTIDSNFEFFYENNKDFKFTASSFLMTVMLNNDELFNAMFEISGRLRPINLSPSDAHKKVHISFKIITANAKLISSNLIMKKEHRELNNKGLTAFINSMIDYYFLAYFSESVLGSGIVISYGVPFKSINYSYEDENLCICILDN